MAQTTYLGGKAEICIGALKIEPQFLSTINVNFTEGTRSVSSLAGNVTRPSGTIDSATITGTMILPSMDALKIVYNHLYKAPTGSEADLKGRVEFGGDSCEVQATVPVDIHYTCENNSDNDFYLPAGLVQANFNMTYNATDAPTVEFTILAQPDENGLYGFAGAGDLEQKTIYDVTTQTFIPVVTPSA